MTDTCARWHDGEIIERCLTPFQEVITLHIALILALDVFLFRFGCAKIIDHDGMVDDQMHRVQRVNRFGRTAQFHNRVAHGGEVHNGWHAGEILHQNPCGAIGDLMC